MHKENTFMRLFLSDIILRPSCYQCRCKEGKSGADITIADFWGIENIAPEMDDDKGTSLVIIQSEKGKQTFSLLNVIKKEQTYEEASRCNQSLKSACRPHPKREIFWKMLDEQNLDSLCNRLLKDSYKVKIKREIKWIIHRVIRLIRL